jgi:hypothetical protein
MSETESVTDELGFMQWLIDANGYRDPRPIGDGRYACIRPMTYTHAIITGQIGDCAGVDRHWCYHSYAEAKLALTVWDGTGEPAGWHRDPVTGRRLAEGPGPHIDENGNEVPIGTIYVRP